MLDRLIRFALTQRVLILLLVALIVGGGWYAFDRTPIDAFPDVSTTQVKIIIKAPGMTPDEVETRITAQIEVEMLGIPRQSMLRSVTKYALTDITVDFEEGTDIYWARQQVAERLARIWAELPEDISGGIAPMTTPLGEMFMFTIDGGELNNQQRRDLLDWVIRPALRSVPGVADVNALGGVVKTYEVTPDNARMYARRVSLAELREALERNNRNDGAGRLNDGEEVLLVRTEGSIRSLDDVRDIVVRADAREPIRVVDLASVRTGALTRYGAVTRNGSGEAVEGLVLGLRGANAREVVDGVRSKLDDLMSSLPDGVEINIFYDRGQLIDQAVGTVTRALMEASILVVILLVLFLGDLRAALTVALILPLSALATFILMHRFGMSANLMSLGGLAIAVGMLVDAAVVVVENVITHLSRRDGAARLPRLHLIYRAAGEVAVPVTSGILIIIIVFLPLLTLQGLEGKLFIPVALTIVFALGTSIVLSLTVIPVLSSYLIGRVSHDEPRLVKMLQAVYRPALSWALTHTRSVAGAAMLLLVLAALVYTQIGKSFMPTMDEGDLIVQLEKLPSISLQKSIDIDMRVQRSILEQVPEVTGIVARAGSDELGLDPDSGRDLVSFVEDARQLVAREVTLPAGYYLEWGGQFENQQRAARRLSIVVPVALALIFLTLFSTFRSVRQSVLVLVNIPFALIGGVVALGRPITEVVTEGAQRRLRPVLMTASIAAFGLVPLLFASGPGSEIQRPLAIVVIGGLVSSTLLTLFLLPILYRRFGVVKNGA